MAVTLERRQAGQMAADRELSTRAAAEAYIGGVCFKLGPPGLIGAELEWLTTHGECPASGPTAAPRPPLDLLADALGPYAPRSIAPDSPALALPGGSRVTIEPGGQIELSSAPYATAAQLIEQLRADTEMLRKLLETQCVGMVSAAADAGRRARRVLRLPRYQAMERYLAGLGPFGKLMMCNTAAIQVSVDAGTDPAEAVARWTALYAIGPALSAAFACSPELRGAPAGEWASQRMRTWLRLDHSRTRPPVEDWADPIAGYARWALDAPLLCVRSREPETGASSSAGEWDRGLGTGAADCSWAAPPGATFADWLSGALDDEVGRRPDRSDLDYHLTTMFPPVRPSGHLEVRYLDAQPDESWTVPIDVIDALMSSPAAVAEATGIAGPTAGRWLDAARCGLADREIRAAAAELLDAAATHAATPAAADAIHAAAQRCRSARHPGRLESGSAS
ncbi:ergothioneine biosynthesis glutamate--cysteine ligase EgtA [Nocardia cyriacigeorgica]|uniref:ergothioneine biosynthesis glutamate--cysteine ligase EgtA n=1 Tax=Nocardia cyriacigeorgica TaxID=135487 RepID=UPI0009D9A6C1|nr:ergothioneine biosynthesis glutamate--cysteine ligase EgtA [Nocardia cyriacigeorgica]TLF59455.1 ergothioneine biosynthesis glutamate--cysteine ligase EgtA [Nocardia cyriacigeorgica]